MSSPKLITAMKRFFLLSLKLLLFILSFSLVSASPMFSRTNKAKWNTQLGHREQHGHLSPSFQNTPRDVNIYSNYPDLNTKTVEEIMGAVHLKRAKSLDLSSRRLPNSLLKIVSEGLYRSTLLSLNMSSCHITGLVNHESPQTEIFDIVKSISQSMLEEIDLSDNFMIPEQQLIAFFNFLPHTSIKKLYLSKMHLSENALSALISVLNKTKIEVLDLSNNLIGHQYVEILANILPGTKIEQLFLSSITSVVTDIENFAGEYLDDEQMDEVARIFEALDRANETTEEDNTENHDVDTANVFSIDGIRRFSDSNTDTEISTSGLSSHVSSSSGNIFRMDLDNVEEGEEVDSRPSHIDDRQERASSHSRQRLRAIRPAELREITERLESMAQETVDEIAKTVTALGKILTHQKLIVADFSFNGIKDGSLDLILYALPLTKVQNLSLAGNALKNRAVHILMSSLPNTPIEVLDLSKNVINSDGLLRIAYGIPYLKKLVELNLSNNNFGQEAKEAFRILSENLPATRLKKLYLNGNHIDSSYLNPLSVVMGSSPVQSLALEENQLGISRGIDVLLKLLESSNLETLNIEDNNITEKAVQMIAKKLTSSKIKNFDLSFNNISAAALKLITRALSDWNLLSLIIRHSFLNNAALHSLSQYLPDSSLKILDISQNNFTTKALTQFGEILPKTHLTHLYLEFNVEGGNVSSIIQSLPNTQITHLSFKGYDHPKTLIKQLSKVLPLTKLKWLDISKCLIQNEDLDEFFENIENISDKYSIQIVV